MAFKKHKKKKRPRRGLTPSEIQELVQESKKTESPKNRKLNEEELNNKITELQPYDKLLQYYNITQSEEDYADDEIIVKEEEYLIHNKFTQLKKNIEVIPIKPESETSKYFDSFNVQFKQFRSDCGNATANECTITPRGFEPYKTSTNHPFIAKLMPDLSTNSLYLAKEVIKNFNKNYLNAEEPAWDSIPLQHNYYSSPQSFLEQIQSEEFVTLYTSLSRYVDVMFTDLNYLNTDAIRLCYSLHILSFIVQHRNAINLNTAKNAKNDVSEPFRDQGFTRPTVVILAPTKASAQHIIKIFSKLLPISKKGLERFESEFGVDEEKIAEQKEHFLKTNKPLDFIHAFNGDSGDCFRFGIRYENGQLHLFSGFNKSDIIIASPLGLRGVLETNKNVEEIDFLSSIQILLIDSANLIQFQNWSFLLQVVQEINKPLKGLIKSDIRRLRMSCIDGFVANYRQTVIISSYPSILINDLFLKSVNCRGSIRLSKPSIESSLKCATLLGIRQNFIKVHCNSLGDSQTAILNIFIQSINSLAGSSGLMIVVQDYSHYLQIKQALSNSQIQYNVCHEYSSNKKLSSARREFYHGECKILLTTFRFVFFKRYLIRGGDSAIILGPPEYPPEYNHVLQSLKSLKGSSVPRVTCYYTNYSGIALKNLFGKRIAERLLFSEVGLPNVIT